MSITTEHPAERAYLDLLERILRDGAVRANRTGIKTTALFDQRISFDLREGFPLLTTKKVPFEKVLGELLFFLSGSNDLADLQALGVHIWDKDHDAPSWRAKRSFDGDLGRIYGVQWRRWETREGFWIDQIANVIEQIKLGDNRRMIVTAWNPEDIEDACLPPCHYQFQFHEADGVLHLGMTMRSCDMFLGVPFNIASYALLLSMVAQVTGKVAGALTVNLGDAHIYHTHLEQVRTQVARTGFPFPRLVLNPDVTDIDGFGMDDVALVDYQSHPFIKAEMASEPRPAGTAERSE